MKTLLVGLCLMIGACGGMDGDEGGNPPPGGTGGTGSTPPPAPTNHVITPEQPEMLAPNMGLFVGPWTLPTTAVVTYTITNRSTTTPDRWDVGIMAMSELYYFQNGMPYRAFGLQENVSTTNGSFQIPAGTYYFVVACRNVVERCQFSYSVSALY